MKITGKYLIMIIACLLIFLFVYTAVSKVIEFDKFRSQMYKQALPHWLSAILIRTLPAIELVTASGLAFKKTRLTGFYAALVLMLLFTGYIALVLLSPSGTMPCSCGGVIKALGWKMHLVFNIFFVLLTLCGIYLINRERRVIGAD